MANGTITDGQGTARITFTAGATGTPVTMGVTEANPDPTVCIASPGNASVPVLAGGEVLQFHPLTPCRVADTRDTPDGPLAGPALQPGATRAFAVAGFACGIPAEAKAVSVNATVTAPGAAGFLTLAPGGAAFPLTSTINFSPGQTRANNAVVTLATDGSGRIDVTNGATAPVHFILDVNGYFR
jgi:hypothetical protein